MTQIHSHAGNKHKKKQSTFFDRQELRQLLDVYSRRVATGEWKDYAIDHQGPVATFSVFRNTFDTPLFAIAKRTNGGKCDYIVFNGYKKMKQAATIQEALKVFRQPLRLVSSRH
jgi:hypothetical protein